VCHFVLIVIIISVTDGLYASHLFVFVLENMMEEPGKFTVLIVEDSKTIRFMYKGVLANHGYSVIEAETGEDGWIKTVEMQPDLVVLDLILPDLHGLEVLKKIRSNEMTQDIPVLILSNIKNIQDVHKALNLGINYYGYKGNDSPQKILGMIQKILSKRDQS